MRWWSCFFIFLLISSNISIAQETLKQGDIVYVNPATENLRASPNGSVVTQIPQGTKLTVLGEQGNWVAVQIVGWIWKPSLIKSKDEIKGFKMRALHILVETEAEAKEIKALLDKGEDFATLAKQKSKGPNAKRGGDLGNIHKGDLMPELDSAIRNINVGQISGIIKSELGYHIFKRLE